MNIQPTAVRRQSGAALVVLLTLLIVVSAAFLLDRLGGDANASAAGGAANGEALADAKAALIAWATTYPPSAARQSTAGTLPYPDRNGDGNYDGMADCDALGVNDLVLVGRLPRLGEDSLSVANCGVDNPLNIDLQDGAGEPLWYAVSRNVLAGVGVAGGPINPDMGGPGRMAYPWIQLRDDQGNVINDPNTGTPLAVAAVIFAPGAVVANQDRSGAAAPSNYLDSVTIGATTYDNADADGCPDNTSAPCGGAGEEFVVYPNPQSGEDFDDALLYITVDELMRAVEKRVLGETALALDAYRTAGWNTNSVYPWLAGFRNPRAGSSGTATGGSTTRLDDTAADFVADGIQVGDIVTDSNGGGSGLITAVTATRIDFGALLGGTDDNFGAGENYDVQASFKSTLTPNGQLPMHRRNEIFATSFNAQWHLHSVDEVPSGSPPALIPDDDEIQGKNYPPPPTLPSLPENTITVTTANGRCLWTEGARVDCVGIQVIPVFWRADLGINVERTIQVSFSFTGTTVTITPPAPGDVRRRSVRIGSTVTHDTALTDPVVQPAPMLPQSAWSIIVGDDDGTNAGTMQIDLNGSDGWIAVNDIRYDLSVVYNDADDPVTTDPLDPWDEVPEWFAENDWHHFIFAAFSSDVVAGGDGDCLLPGNTCLSLNVAGTAPRTDIGALLLSSGVEWTNQDRTIGDCDGDSFINPVNDSFLCAYFDGDTTLYNVFTDVLRHGANTGTDIITADFYARDIFSAGFNDQIRIVDPLPP